MTNLIRRVQKHFKLKADFQPYIQSLVLKSGRREHCKIKTKKSLFILIVLTVMYIPHF